MAITVRRARPDDGAFIESVGEESAAASISRVRPADRRLAIASFQRLMDFCRDRSGATTLIAENGEKRLGFLILLSDVPDEVTQSRQGFIAYMAVDARARRAGAGRALIAAAEEEARALGMPHLSLMVSNDNAAARKLYASAGFVDERTLMTKPTAPRVT